MKPKSKSLTASFLVNITLLNVKFASYLFLVSLFFLHSFDSSFVIAKNIKFSFQNCRKVCKFSWKHFLSINVDDSSIYFWKRGRSDQNIAFIFIAFVFMLIYYLSSPHYQITRARIRLFLQIAKLWEFRKRHANQLRLINSDTVAKIFRK